MAEDLKAKPQQNRKCLELKCRCSKKAWTKAVFAYSYKKKAAAHKEQLLSHKDTILSFFVIRTLTQIGFESFAA